jgi:hypothetical protein
VEKGRKGDKSNFKPLDLSPSLGASFIHAFPPVYPRGHRAFQAVHRCEPAPFPQETVLSKRLLCRGFSVDGKLREEKSRQIPTCQEKQNPSALDPKKIGHRLSCPGSVIRIKNNSGWLL